MEAIKYAMMTLLGVLLLGSTLSAEARYRQFVNCDKGQSVAKALRYAYSGSKIIVRGVCHERIKIRRNNIRIIGYGNAGFDGSSLSDAEREFNPLISVKDSVGVVIKNVFVRNSPAEGLLIEGQSSVRLINISAKFNTNVGMLVDHARVEIEGGEYEGNQAGIDTTNGASTILRGEISLQNNGVFGIAASNAASLEARGTVMNASGNQLAGVLLESGQLAIFNFGVSQGSQVIADNNGLCGFVLVGGGYLDILAPPPLQFTGINKLSASNNQACGILMATGSIVESPFGAATIQIEGNPAGMQVTGNSNVSINGGLNIINNLGPGLIADGAGVITLAPSDPSPPPALQTRIENNNGPGPDVILSFGSRASFATNVSIGSINCDGTALARGSTTCP